MTRTSFYKRNRLTIAQLLKALDRKESFVKHSQESDQKDNPQVIEMRIRTEGEIIALQAVLDAMRGDCVGINILSDGCI